jgi:hypothetical protein
MCFCNVILKIDRNKTGGDGIMGWVSEGLGQDRMGGYSCGVSVVFLVCLLGLSRSYKDIQYSSSFLSIASSRIFRSLSSFLGVPFGFYS